MKRLTMGILLGGIGVVHNLIGLFVGREHLWDIAMAGGFNSIPETEPWRIAIFWFLFFGWMLMLLGGAMHWGESNGLKPPAALLIGFAALGIAGVFFIPASGFWLIFPVVALGWTRYFRGT